MTLPNSLVQAAAEAICIARTVECRRLGCCEFYEDHARLALAAAFAALDTCSEAIEATTRHVSNRTVYEERKKALAALAREFGEGT